jgi:ketosteroid isomerase-like protein
MISILALIVFAVSAAAQTVADITAVEKDWAQKVRTRDVKALEKLLADDLIYAHSTGIVDNKQTYLSKIGEGRQVYKTVDHQKIEVRLHGSSAVTHCIMRMAGTNQAGPFDDKVMMIHVWVKKGASWILAAHQTTKVP